MATMWKFSLLFVPLLACAATGQAIPATQPAIVDAGHTDLGPVFASRVAGIQFRPPAGGTLIRQIGGGDLVRFVYPQRGWELKVRVMHRAKPLPLSGPPPANLSGGLP